jgi:hypothetical protein
MQILASSVTLGSAVELDFGFFDRVSARADDQPTRAQHRCRLAGLRFGHIVDLVGLDRQAPSLLTLEPVSSCS